MYLARILRDGCRYGVIQERRSEDNASDMLWAGPAGLWRIQHQVTQVNKYKRLRYIKLPKPDKLMSRKAWSGKIIPDPDQIKPKRSESDRILRKTDQGPRRGFFSKLATLKYVFNVVRSCILILVHAEEDQKEKGVLYSTSHIKIHPPDPYVTGIDRENFLFSQMS